MCASIDAVSGWICTTVTSSPASLTYSLKAISLGSLASMNSTRPGTRFRSPSSCPGLSRLVAMKMNGDDIATPPVVSTLGVERRDLPVPSRSFAERQLESDRLERDLEQSDEGRHACARRGHRQQFLFRLDGEVDARGQFEVEER